jgi:hypothetical protein
MSDELTQALDLYERVPGSARGDSTLGIIIDAARRWAALPSEVRDILEAGGKVKPVWCGSVLSQTWHVTDDPEEAEAWLFIPEGES